MKNFAIWPFLLLTCCISVISCKTKETVQSKVELEAIPFRLSDTRLSEGSPFKHAMDKNTEWLLEIEPDRLLHRFHVNAGLEPKGDVYGGWESRGVSGHTLGHYLSACARMYAASGDKRFKERVDYIVSELTKCQNARKTGYVGAIPDEDKIWAEVSSGDIRSAGFDLNGGWVPWYTQHKVLAGLIDACLYAENEQAKAVAVKLSDWVVKMFDHLTEQQFQAMLVCEFGGMNEALAEMYALTGNESYLRLANKFYHKAILDPLKEQRDELVGKHSNTQIPKIIGAARLYELTADKDYHAIATYFWDRMVHHHSYLNGGNSNYEHLGLPDQLNDRLSAFTSETCNTYNMLKLTNHLFSWDGKSADYFDYYERALYNHILASQNPATGMVCYCVPLESGTEKAYSTPDHSFWCCVGSGIENHTKYAESVFYQSSDGGLLVNLFIPVSLNWGAKNMTVTMETEFPEDNLIHFKFKGKAQKFPLRIRYPKWAKDRIKVRLNGAEKEITPDVGTYFTLEERWGEQTTLELEIPMSIYTESMPDNPSRIGIFYGPLLLAAGLGKEEVQVYDIPVFISDSQRLEETIKPVDGKPLTFTTSTYTSPENIELVPFYKTHEQKYAVYFDVFSTQDWKSRKKEYQMLYEKHQALKAKTVDEFRPGEMQPERDHELKSQHSNAGSVEKYKYRDAFNGWFSFKVQVKPDQPVRMLCTYWGTDKEKRNFDIYIDDQYFRSVSLKGEHGKATFDEQYDIPQSFTKGKEEITVKFQSHKDNYAGGLFGFRILTH